MKTVGGMDELALYVWVRDIIAWTKNLGVIYLDAPSSNTTSALL